MNNKPFIRPLPQQPNYRPAFHVADFSGGLNNVDGDITLQDNQLLDCNNMMLTDNFGIEKRYGSMIVGQGLTETPDEGIILWYDEFTLNEQTHVITVTKNQVFIDDVEYLGLEIQQHEENDIIEGIVYNGFYFFTFRRNLYRIELESEKIKVRKVINDPKLFISDVTAKRMVTTAMPVTEYVLCGDLEEEYSIDSEYYADNYGLYKLTNVADDVEEITVGEVNSSNYKVYYKKQVNTEAREGVYLTQLKFETLLQQAVEEVKFCFVRQPFFGTKVDNVLASTENDYVFNLVYPIITQKTVDIKYDCTYNGVDAVTFTESVVDADPKLFIPKEDMPDIWSQYESYLEKHTQEEADIYLINLITDSFVNVACRFYEARPESFVVGEIVKDDKNIWYQPCKNELYTSSLGENYIPTAPRALTIYQNRLWTTGDTERGNEVRGTQVLEALYFPAAISMSLPLTEDRVQDIFEFDGTLIVGRNKDMYAIFGSSASATSSDLFTLKRMDVTTGLMCNNCGNIINNHYLFLGYDGDFYALRTPNTNTDYLMISPLTRFIDITRPPLNIDKKHLTDVSCVALNNIVYWVIGDKILVYSYTNQSFVYWSGLNCYSFYTNGRELYYGSKDYKRFKFEPALYRDEAEWLTNEGDVMPLYTGRPIQSVIKTKPYHMGNPINYKMFKQMMLTMIRPVLSVLSSVDVQVKFDTNNPIIRETKHIRIEGQSLYDYAKWDINKFAFSAYQKTLWQHLNFRSRTVSVILKNNLIDETFKVADFSIIYTNGDVR